MTFPSINIISFFERKIFSLLLIFFFGSGVALFSQQANFENDKNIPERPNPPHLVNDFANLFSDRDGADLESKLVAYNDSTSTQITVVTVNSLEGYAEDDYAIRLARKWGIGQEKTNNGLLILISKEDRAVDIEVGYGLESYISDGDAKRIIEDLMIPQFRQSNYYTGVNDATEKIIGLLQGTYKSEGSNNNTEIPTWAIIIIILVLVFFVLPSVFRPGRSGGWISGGSGGWISGGGSSWGGGGSGGFGGFGGGSFGGGGASGRW